MHTMNVRMSAEAATERITSP